MKKNIFVGAIIISILFTGIAIGTQWSEYSSMSSGTIADDDTFLVRDVSDTSLSETGTQKQYPFSVAVVDLLQSDRNAKFGTLAAGNQISSTGVESPVWEKMDANNDVVASCTVVCSDITDGQQVCQIKFYVMSDTPGTLTNELTIDVDTD